LRRLPPRQKEIVILKAQGYKYREIGEKLGISTGTVSNAFWKIRQKVNPI
jgi:RNA polymerase sigma factor (sigma-70 family)